MREVISSLDEFLRRQLALGKELRLFEHGHHAANHTRSGAVKRILY